MSAPVAKILKQVAWEMRKSSTLVFEKNILADHFPGANSHDISTAEAITTRVFRELARGTTSSVNKEVMRRANATLINNSAGSRQLEGKKMLGHHTKEGRTRSGSPYKARRGIH